MNKEPFLSLEEREKYEENIFLHLNARISTLEALLREVFREVIDSDKIRFETFRSIQKELGEG